MLITRRYREKPRMRAALTILGFVAAISAFAKDPLLVADPATPLAEAWTHQSFGTATEYKGILLDGVAAIRAIGRNSATGLYRNFRYRIALFTDNDQTREPVETYYGAVRALPR